MSVGRAEWLLVPEAACLASASLAWSLVIARGLRVDVTRMTENLGRLGGLLLSEPVMLRLGTVIGRNAAHDIVYESAMAAFEGRGKFRDLLLGDARVAHVMTAAELDVLLDPAAYTGQAGVFVDRVVKEARRRLG
jgi:adenylosuccinate lyase